MDSVFCVFLCVLFVRYGAGNSMEYIQVPLPSGTNNNLSVAVVNSDPTFETILLLHGFPEGSTAWYELVPFLAPFYNLIMPDQRGYNLSYAPSSMASYTQDQLVSDAVAIVQTLVPGGRVHLIGHDWGGIIAWVLASQRPDLFQDLTILNSPHPNIFTQLLQSNVQQQAMSSYIKFFVTDPTAPSVLSSNNFALLMSFFSNETWFTPQRVPQYLSAWSISNEVANILNWYIANIHIVNNQFGPDTTTTFPSNLVINIPTLVIWGLKDNAFLLPDNLSLLTKYISPTLLTVQQIPSATHWIAHEQAGQVASTFIQWQQL